MLVFPVRPSVRPSLPYRFLTEKQKKMLPMLPSAGVTGAPICSSEGYKVMRTFAQYVGTAPTRFSSLNHSLVFNLSSVFDTMFLAAAQSYIGYDTRWH